MLKHKLADRVFHALADANRRAVIERLTRGPATVSELAAQLGVTVAATVQHLQVLQDSELVWSEKVGRVRTCQIDPAGLRNAEAWLQHQRTTWEHRLDRLGAVLDDQTKELKIMTRHSVKHSTFTLERTYAAPPAAVFAAWSDRDTKAQWFAAEDGRYSLDFRVGGTEAVHGGDRVDLVAKSEYHDIVPDERIVYTTTLFTDQILSTVSLTTVRFDQDGDGTRLVLTEQGTFLDNQEQPKWREQGTGDWLDALGRQVAHR